MSEPGAGAGAGHGGTSGNDFRGPAAAQTGQHNTQVNHYAEPRSKVWLMVTGAAAVVLTVGTVLALLRLGDDSGGASQGGQAVPPGAVPSPQVTGLATAPASAQSGPAASPSGVLAAPSDAVQWTGVVRIAESGPKLDAVPPTTEKYARDVRLALVDPPRLAGADSSLNPTNLAEWKGQGKPGRKECADLVSTQGVGHMMTEVKEGTVICVRTTGGRTAVLTVTSTSNSFSTGVMAETTVWSQASGGH
ncbi:hypothetical protein [Streptomyces griseocarneus]|uniref:hypothetical protein n=1 Tax=Streptomyces griseocarneus TaxID=51201 RepID=UPI00167EB2EB|nr:hypothetical protein [Streptomyces griseocarneus]MBZ6476839.1 hypothetical protein [Streptomyces griseocarneus]GHG81131.1 hypothetical protein GCM10018779_63120 [Streptomyces griseocarneus]